MRVRKFEFDFPDAIEVTRYSRGGTPYSTRISAGMPRIPDQMATSAFFLYKSEVAACNDSPFGGTGFLVGVMTDTDPVEHYIYGVTNAHNTESGSTVIRLNTVSGELDVIPLKRKDWVVHPDGYDIAVTGKPLSIRAGYHEVTFIEADEFFYGNKFQERDLGIGDDVVMAGRFVDLKGHPTNQPTVRFGNISVMPIPVMNEHSNKKVESYLLDMHSRSGYSGSPVFVFRFPRTNLHEAQKGTGEAVLADEEGFSGLLGIHWGQFPETWECESTQGKLTIDAKSGMTLVHAASRIWELLNMDELRKTREINDAEIRERKRKESTPRLKSSDRSEPEVSGDDNLRVMLNTPPTPHKGAKKRVSSK